MSGSRVLLVRLARAMLLLERRTGVTVEELAGELGVCRRQAFRYLNVLEELYAIDRLETEEGPRRYRRLRC